MNKENRVPSNYSQNNFAIVKKNDPKSSVPLGGGGGGVPPSILSQKSTTSTSKAPTKKKKPELVARVDRFGKLLENPQQSDYDRFLSPVVTTAPASSGNSFAPIFVNPREGRVVGGHGIKYTFSLLMVVAVVFLLFNFPQIVPIFYCATLIPLFMYRFVTYYRLARHHFTFEICYFVNYAVMVYIIALPNQYQLFFVAFALSHSVAIGSTIALNFKLVFSDIQIFIK